MGSVVGVPHLPHRIGCTMDSQEQSSFPFLLGQSPSEQVPALFHGVTGRKSLEFIYLTQIKGLSHVTWHRARI